MRKLVRSKITTMARPYTLTFASGNRYPLTSDEAQRLIDNYPAVNATKNRVVLLGDDGTRSIIMAATLGGGPAFLLEKQ